MATTGANTSAQWKTAASNATEAAYAADAKAFQAEQAISDAKGNVYRANTALEAAKQSGNPTAIAAANQQLQTANNSVTQQQAVAAEYRTQANNAGNDAAAATDLAAKNSGETPSTPPPAAATPAAPATAYTPEPAIQPVTSPSPALTSTYQANATTVTNTTTTTTAVENTTGGSSTTTYYSPPLNTPASENLSQQSNQAYKEAALYNTNPDTPYGAKSLDNKLASGQITQAQYDSVKNSTLEERQTKAIEASAKGRELSDQANDAKVPVPPEVVRKEEPNTTATTVDTVQTKTVETAKVTGTIDGTNVTTETVDGTSYQVTKNTTENTTTFTDPANPQNTTTLESTNVENSSPQPVSTFEDPAQRGQAADQVAIDQAATTNNVQDPAQRQQAEEIVENYQAPAVDQTDAETARLARQNDTIENAAPADVNQDPAETARLARAEAAAEEADTTANQSAAETARLNNSNKGLTASQLNTNSQATQQDVSNFKAKEDWRVRLSLSPGATYLYKTANPGILAPLQATDGVIFPYTPAIVVQYSANYDPTELTHSNYKFFSYRSSAVDTVSITCDFTAQDTKEANYLLAVIHFFKSMTKMFYGQDNGPVPGTPPPLCYLSGLGTFQFDAHPLAITGFNYALPTDVDYIRAGSSSSPAGVNTANNPTQGKPGESLMAQAGASRMGAAGLNLGATASAPNFSSSGGTKEPTYVPTKMSISITAVPIMTRNDISNKFSLKEYATGALLRGTKRSGGGMW